MTPAQSRALRTFAALLLAVAAAAGPVVALAGVDAATYAKVAAAIGGLATIITGAVNALEDHDAIPVLLGKTPEPAVGPVDDIGPDGEVRLDDDA